MRIDRAVRPPGLIRRARTHSLFADAEGLWVICTGPAGRAVAVDNALEQFAVNKVYAAYEKKIVEGEARLATVPLAELAKEKHSRHFALTDIAEAAVDETFSGVVRLTLRAAGEKLAFEFHPSRKNEVAEFAAQMGNGGSGLKT